MNTTTASGPAASEPELRDADRQTKYFLRFIAWNLLIFWSLTVGFFVRLSLTHQLPADWELLLLFRLVQDLVCVGLLTALCRLAAPLRTPFRLAAVFALSGALYSWLSWDFLLSVNTGFRMELPYLIHSTHLREIILSSGLEDSTEQLTAATAATLALSAANTVLAALVRWKRVQYRLVPSLAAPFLLVVLIYAFTPGFALPQYSNSLVKLTCDWARVRVYALDADRERQIIARDFSDPNELAEPLGGEACPLFRRTAGFRGGKKFSIDMTAPPRHVIMIFIESARGADCGLTEQTAASLTPNLDRLAETGVRFTNFHASGMGTVRAMFAALYGVLPMYSSYTTQENFCSTRLTGLPQIFVRNRYSSFFFNGCNLGFARKHRFYSQQGFMNLFGEREIETLMPGCSDGPWGVNDRDLYAFCLNTLTRADRVGGNTFSTVLTVSTHNPFPPPDDSLAADWPDSPRERYAECLRYADRELDRFVRELQRRGLAEKSLLVILGDHGIAFPEERTRTIYSMLDEASVLVPLVILAPGRLRRPAVVREDCSGIDLLPTLVDIMGFAGTENHAMGRSLMRHAAAPRPIFFFNNSGAPTAGLKYGRYKYMLETSSGKQMLYDLTTDREEQFDLAPQYPDLTSGFRHRIIQAARLANGLGLRDRYRPPEPRS